jgi:hypothetical protein
VTFDSTIHFYSLRPGAEKPQMFVESDLADIFLPVCAPLSALTMFGSLMCNEID